MNNDKITLLGTGLLALYFLVCGLLQVLDNLIIKIILFLGFFGIIANIIIVKSKDEDDPEEENEKEENEKNLLD